MSAAFVEAQLAAFERLAAARAGSPAWLHAVRKAAVERFAEHGFPTAKLEDWKHTNVRRIAEGGFVPSERAAARGMSPADALAALGPGFAGPVLAFVNGRFAPELSRVPPLAGGAHAGSLRAALASDPGRLEPHLARVAGFEDPAQAFAALNTAFLDDGAFVHLPPGADLAEPIGLVFLFAANGASAPLEQPRALIVAEPESRATIVESYAGARGAHLTNAVTEVVADAGAEVVHLRLQHESPDAFHVGALRAVQGRDSRFRSTSISVGAALARHDIGSRLDAEGPEAVLDGLFVAGDNQHVDHHTEIDHARPNGRSSELYKGILGGRARGVFNGKIIVRKDAQKTDARQRNPNLLVSDRAHINTKPQLEIHADDVRCAHGSTIGHLDDQALFYLRTRGIAAPDARDLLTRAFAAEVSEALPVAALRELVARILLEQISGPRNRMEAR